MALEMEKLMIISKNNNNVNVSEEFFLSILIM